MTSITPLSSEQTLDILAVTETDRAEALALFTRQISSQVETVIGFLTERLGSSELATPKLEAEGQEVSELDWLAGMMHFVPQIRAWHAEKGVSDKTSRASLADFGRNLAINRRVHGRFGMDTYKWLLHTFAGRLFGLGRLQFLIHQPSAGIPGVADGDWILGVHIPEGGSLNSDAVAESLSVAKGFFADHFPDHPVKVANCESWLLDPYLRDHISPESNIAKFAALFSPYAPPRDEPTDAVYFTFRTRDMTHLEQLPRETALQKLVLERIDNGGQWQIGLGCLTLP